MAGASYARGCERTGWYSMPDFTLIEEQRNIRDLAHDFAQKEIRPVAWDYDRDATWPQEIIEKAWELGLMTPSCPSGTAAQAPPISTAP